MFFILFFIIGVFLVLTGGNFFIYITLVKLFDLSGWHRTALLYIFILLSSGFFLSSVLLYNSQAAFFRYFYVFSSIWVGVSFYLLQLSVLAWLFWIFSKYWQIKISKPTLGFAIIIASALICVYGIVNAQQIKIKTIEVAVKNLPKSWEEKTAVQITDAHLGAVNGVKFAEKIAMAVNSIRPDIVFITGDLYDGTLENNLAQIEEIESISAPDGIFMVSGNHETYVGIDKVTREINNSAIRILNDEVIEVGGMQIAGAGYPINEQPKDMHPLFEKIKPEMPAIFLYHSPNLDSIKTSIEHGVDLQLAGHTHQGQLFPNNFITELFFHGFDYGLHTLGDYNIYTSCGVGTWGPPMKTICVPEIVLIKFLPAAKN